MKKNTWKKMIAAALAGTMVWGMAACGSSEDGGSKKDADSTADSGSASDTGEENGGEKAGKVAIVYTVTGKGDLSFNDSAYKGAERAVEELGVELVAHCQLCNI